MDSAFFVIFYANNKTWVPNKYRTGNLSLSLNRNTSGIIFAYQNTKVLKKLFIWIMLLGGFATLYACPYKPSQSTVKHGFKAGFKTLAHHHYNAHFISRPDPGKDYPSHDMVAPLFENEENDDLKSSRKYLKNGPAFAIIFLTEEYNRLNESDQIAMYEYVQLLSSSFHQPAFLQVFRI